MNYLKYLGIVLLPILLASCNDGKTKTIVKPAEEVYDYRDERYQDFYSRYMRKVKKHYLIFKPQDIQKKMNIEDVPNNVYGRMNVYRIDPIEKIEDSMNYFKYSKDVENYFNKKSAANNIFSHYLVYFYFPDNKYKKINNINYSINFSCNKMNDLRQCLLSNYPGGTYNINIDIHFTNPQNFFYIMPFIEQHFYDITGDHIWQTLPNKN